MQAEVLVVWMVVMVAAIMHGTTGLGFGLITVPILVLFQDARSVIVTSLVLTTVLNAMVLYQTRGHLTLRNAGPILLGTLLGVPLGSYLLTVLDTEVLKGMVGVLVLFFSVPLLLGYTRQFRNQRVAYLFTGAVSGALQSSTAMGSPPMVLFLANQEVPKEAFRGMQVFRSMAASTLSVVALVPTGLINLDLATHILYLVPALLIGFVAGGRLVKLIPQAAFQRLTILTVSAAALASLVGSLL